MKTEIIKLENITPESLVAIEQRKAELKKLVADNPFVACTKKTYPKAKARRTALRKGRTTIQNEVKVICSKLAGVSKSVKDKGNELIAIVQGAEEKQQVAITTYEEEVEREKQRKAKEEQERKDKIKGKITEWEEGVKEKIRNIQEATDLEALKEEVAGLTWSPEILEEFGADLNWSKSQVSLLIGARSTEIQNEQLHKEKEALEQKLKEAEQKKKELLNNKAETEEAQPGPDPVLRPAPARFDGDPTTVGYLPDNGQATMRVVGDEEENKTQAWKPYSEGAIPSDTMVEAGEAARSWTICRIDREGNEGTDHCYVGFTDEGIGNLMRFIEDMIPGEKISIECQWVEKVT